MNKKHPRLSRRKFMGGLAAASASLAGCGSPEIIPSTALGLNGAQPPSNRVAIGMIGAGSHGIHRNLSRFLPEPDAHVVAVCDVDSARCEDARARVETLYEGRYSKSSYRGCDSYNDFRDIIDRDDIDAVMVSTPDHWHAIPSIMAARSGKDVMCEKPLSLTVAEGRAIAEAMRRHNRVFQTASENRSVEEYHRMCELVRNGRIGKLQTIWVDLPSGHWVKEASREFGPPPQGFDYDLWLGPAPDAPYCAARCHWNFRWILDYSGGMLTDWGAHLIDLAQWGNNSERTGPIEVEGAGEFPAGGLYNTATKFRVEYRYANGVRLIVSSSEPGIRFEGSEGWIGNAGWRGELQASSQSILDSIIEPGETRLYTCPGGEQRNFLDCVASRKPCYAPAEIGHRTIAIAHIGNISMRLGRKLQWDPGKERFVNDAEANAMRSRPMRAPWRL